MFKWLKRIVGLALLAACIVVVLPNAVVVLGQRGNLRTVDQLAEEALVLDEDLPVEAGPGEQRVSKTYDCIMVLGAAVWADGQPSPVLADRLQTAVELYNAGVAPKILMSGDNQSDRETYDEVVNMKHYAVDVLGVPSEDVFCDHAGINTYDSAYRAFHVFGVESMVVVTQEYHQYRALFDANSFPVRAVGVPSDIGTYTFQTYYEIREMGARIADMWKVLTRANATYLSEPVSLDQSGDVTSWQY